MLTLSRRNLGREMTGRRELMIQPRIFFHVLPCGVSTSYLIYAYRILTKTASLIIGAEDEVDTME